MATAHDMRDRQGFGSTMAPPPDEAEQNAAATSSGSDTAPGEPDSAFPSAGPTDRDVPDTANYRPGQGDAGGDDGSGSGGGDQSGSAGSGDDATGSGGQAGEGGAAGDDGGQNAGSGDDGSGSGGSGEAGAGGDNAGDGGGTGGGAGGEDNAGGGLIGEGLGALVPDAVADTGSIVNSAVDDTQTGGGTLLNDAVAGLGALVEHATENLGLGDTGGAIGGLPGNLGGLVPDALTDTQTLADHALGSGGSGVNGIVTDAGSLVDHAVSNVGLGDGIIGTPGGIGPDALLGDGPALTTTVLGSDNGGVAEPLHELTGGLTDGILPPNGEGPLADIGIVGNGSPATTGLLSDAGGGLLSGVGIGRVAEVNGGNDSDVSATIGNGPGQDGPIVDAQAFGDGNTDSQNLLNLGAGPNGQSSSVIATVFGGQADSHPTVDANAVDVGPDGQPVANADVLTSPDHFQFPVLDGAGTDGLAGVLGGVTASPLPAGDSGIPSVDVGHDAIVDVDLSGDAQAGQHDQSLLQTALNGQLIGHA